MQLDIFDDSHQVVLRNLVAQAIDQDDATAASSAVDRLQAEFPDDDALPTTRVLIRVLRTEGEGTAFASHDALRQARLDLEEAIPQAERVLGSTSAAVWLTRRWHQCAARAERLPFEPQWADDYAASLWLKGQNWQAAEQAVTRIASWRRIPAPLAWMTEARLNLLGLLATWPLIAELAWLSPRRLAAVTERSPDPGLQRLVREFDKAFDGEGDVNDLVWFPAWLLTHRSDLRDPLAAAQAAQNLAPERAMRILIELIGYERQGRHHDLVTTRQALRELHPHLYVHYMKIR